MALMYVTPIKNMSSCPDRFLLSLFVFPASTLLQTANSYTHHTHATNKNYVCSCIRGKNFTNMHHRSANGNVDLPNPKLHSPSSSASKQTTINLYLSISICIFDILSCLCCVSCMFNMLP